LEKAGYEKRQKKRGIVPRKIDIKREKINTKRDKN
jgi:hypothetical protein